MKVKTNPIIEFTSSDKLVLNRTRKLCEELIGELAKYTLAENACICCADNGEVFAIEEELYTVIGVLDNMINIIEESPCDCDNPLHKALAVYFVG